MSYFSWSCCQFLWIVLFWFPLRYYLTFIVYPMLPVSLDCPFLISPSVLSNVYLVEKIPNWSEQIVTFIAALLRKYNINTKNVKTHNRTTQTCTFYITFFIMVFTVFRLLTDFVCLYTYEFWLSLCKIVRSLVILLLPLFVQHLLLLCSGCYICI
jgi:hypothetical protein